MAKEKRKINDRFCHLSVYLYSEADTGRNMREDLLIYNEASREIGNFSSSPPAPPSLPPSV